MFRALAVALGMPEIPIHAWSLRHDIVAFIEINRAFFEPSITVGDGIMQEPDFVKMNAPNTDRPLFLNYVRYMRKMGSYGTHLELVAFVSM